MGIYVNPGNEEFKRAVNSKIYVDKTMLLAFTNQNLKSEHQNICVSRPRRFGKSMAANMLVAYYGKGDDSYELFKPFKIAKDPDFKKHLNQYNAIHLNMQQFLGRTESVEEMMELISRKVVRELKREFPQVTYYEEDLVSVLEEIYSQTRSYFVFVIDEWDCIFRVNPMDAQAQKKYLNFLRDLLKNQPYCVLAYMTGILPIKKYGEHSAINMFTEISMINARPISEFTGFTEEEVKNICVKYGRDYEETKRWYDGYCLDGISIYNPKSVVESVLRGSFGNYWTSTETYEALKEHIMRNFDGLKDKVTLMIAGEKVGVNTAKFQNDMTSLNSADDVLTLLVHLGYLTFRAISETGIGEVWIPNSEVRQEFINSVEDGGWENLMKAIRSSDKLLEATLSGESDTVAELIEQCHSENTSLLKYNDENSLACVISLAYYTAQSKYIVHRELATGKGFADLVFIPRKNVELPAIVVELKYNRSSGAAIEQIKSKNYTEKLSQYTGEILLVGINYDDKKGHSCSIEKIVKD